MQRGGARDKGHGAPMKRRAGWLQRLRPFGIGARWSGRPLARPDFGCGCSSGVEHDLAKVGVEGSNPFARSNDFTGLRPDSFVHLHASSTHRVIGNDRPGCNPADLVYDVVDRPTRRAQIVGRIFCVASGASEVRHVVPEDTGDFQLWNATRTQLRGHRVPDGIRYKIFIEASHAPGGSPYRVDLPHWLVVIGDEVTDRCLNPRTERRCERHHRPALFRSHATCRVEID
jgi:hypothetical protein